MGGLFITAKAKKAKTKAVVPKKSVRVTNVRGVDANDE